MVQGGGTEPSCGNGPRSEASKANGGHGHGGEDFGGHDYQNPRIEKVKDAAQTVPGDPPKTKLRPVVLFLPVELVATILTPPGPMPVEQHDGNFGAIVTTPPLARVGKSVIQDQPS